METVLIVAHLFIVIALITVILLQRSEGGALGIGGGGGGGLMSARGSANLLTRTTGILAALFFATSIGLTVLSQLNNESSAILERATEQTDGNVTVLDALNDLNGEPSNDSSGLDLPVPAAETPASTDQAPSQ
ncbi:preprotein translocase subunit SecG [Maritalea porphyrae]|jgi:preprotein translocase subunit SecG|uniref:preprotein translocase subunit SecG n=1 Tax=Maritalea porphyrae TaxID=880732 RepID=UPI0022AEC7FC|nr:preprotein translocase subunit SecG [Maritalea porphyrae]MCZ4273061.1 preprotein translocase subunit SecG [Maritalea porphyrae]